MADSMRNVAQRSVEIPTCEMVADLIGNYAYALDDGNIDLWPGFFTASALYSVTTRENQSQGLPIGIIRCVGRGMMIDRVKAFHTANIFEPHCYNHLVGPVTMRPGRTPESVASRCNFQIVRIMEDGRIALFATGKYLDEIVLDGGVAKFRERIVVLDSGNIDVLIVIPL
jgi:anthranilate 1,2-dioxygenase small subunit